MKKGVIFLLVIMMLISHIFASTDSGVIAITKYKNMTFEELLQKGDLFAKENINDSAFIYYSMIYNSIPSAKDLTSKQIICKALNKASIVCFMRCDYKLSLALLFQSLEMCEEIDFKDYIGSVYNNIGNVYCQFKDYRRAKIYYNLAYQNGCEEGSVLSNLGLIAYNEGNLDSALILYNKSYLIKRQTGDLNYNATLNNLAMVYHKLNMVDSAFFYYYAALRNAREFKNDVKEAIALSNIGPLHLEIKEYDSASYYLCLGNEVASRIKYFDIMSSNYLYLSRIAEAKGQTKLAFNLYKKHSAIKDSLFNVSEYSKINNLQFMYDMGKVDKQIQKLNVEQEIKERTIIIQQWLQIVMGLVLVIVIIFLLLLYLKNKTLNTAYNVLVSKNIEIVESDRMNHQLKEKYEEMLKEKDKIIRKMKKDMSDSNVALNENEDGHKYKKSSLSDDSKNKLISDILEAMNNRELICDPDFSLNHLAEIVGSNQSYVSQTINDAFKRNFRTFINDYRIKEARKMLSDPQYQKYSIKSIATMVGFKSRNTFDTNFKEVIGVTPSFYTRSINREDS